MEGYVHITLDLSIHCEICIDIAVNEGMTCGELVKSVFDSLNLELNNFSNIVLKVRRNGYIVTQSEKLQECGVRDGDVLLLF